MLEIQRLCAADELFPTRVQRYLGREAPASLEGHGDFAILKQKLLAVFCSVKCPGKLILQTYDLAQQLKNSGLAVIGGFHSPVEHECLVNFLHGANPIVVCPARSIDGMRLPEEYKQPLADGRLLLLSPFSREQRRQTVEMASYRNLLVGALADRVFVAYAEPASKTEQFCQRMIAWGKPLYTLDDEANVHLLALGAKPIRPDDTIELI